MAIVKAVEKGKAAGTYKHDYVKLNGKLVQVSEVTETTTGFWLKGRPPGADGSVKLIAQHFVEGDEIEKVHYRDRASRG